MVERFKMHMLVRVGRGKRAGKSTINGYLATLRKALRYAASQLGLINRVPKITLFSKSSVCERQRDFVFSDDEYQRWLEASPELLRDASIMARESGISAGELRALERDCVELLAEEDDALWGQINIRRGLKREARAPILPSGNARRPRPTDEAIQRQSIFGLSNSHSSILARSSF